MTTTKNINQTALDIKRAEIKAHTRAFLDRGGKVTQINNLNEPFYSDTIRDSKNRIFA